MAVEIIPIGEIDNFVLDYLKENLNKIFDMQVSIGSTQPIPEYAHNEIRNQYYSSTILDNLLKLKKNPSRKVLAIIDKDLYVPQLNFVFGEADSINGICIISVTRLRQSYYGLKEDKGLFLKRTLKEAVHEIGHLLDLDHCSNPKCVMYFSNTLSDTDRKDYNFCANCKKSLHK